MTSDSSALHQRVQSEIERLHTFISAWFRGDLPESGELFEQQMASRMGPGLVNIQPSGRALEREELLSSIRGGHGINPDFTIDISECQVRGVFDDGRIVLASYAELQRGARNTTPPENTRVTSVVFEMPSDGGAPTWLHLHETGRP